MEQLHDNGGAVRLCGVSHGRLRLHIPHQFKSTDSVLGCFTWFSGAQPSSSSSFDSKVYPARVNRVVHSRRNRRFPEAISKAISDFYDSKSL